METSEISDLWERIRMRRAAAYRTDVYACLVREHFQLPSIRNVNDNSSREFEHPRP